MSKFKAAGKAKRNRIFKTAPVTRAVRMALAASVAALALAASPGVIASDCGARTGTIACAPATFDFAPVIDLTTVLYLGTEEVPEELFSTAISEYAAGDIVIDNAYSINESQVGDAIAIYGYSVGGNASVHNSGDLSAASYDGLADGIFVSGADVAVDNSGDITAVTVYGNWAAGIEAQGTGTTSVDNSGDIYASAYYGQAFGLYATGGSDVTVANQGNIEAQGYYATGIEAQSSGDVTVTNSGDIVAGSLVYGSYEYNGYVYTYVEGGTAVATGINAGSNGEGAAVGVTNSGDIAAVSYFGGAGISATSSGQGGTASVTNSGNIYASQYTKYGYGAYGIVTSADGDSSIDNSGSIDVVSAGVASGATALSFAGDASVTNSGDITVYSGASLGYSATGITAFAANGNAYVDNSGSVDASAKYWATAVNASAQGDVTVDNSGSLYADGQKYAFGVYALSNAGDVSVHNDDAGDIGFYSYYGRGWGVFAYAGQGDAHVTNDGNIEGYAYGQSSGVFAIAGYGDVMVDNTGSIDVTSGSGVAVGAFARADYGTASVSNSGDITASVGGAFSGGYAAYGILARGGYADVSNSGNIVAEGYYYATGIAASSYYGTTVNNTGGSISAYALGGATGIDAISLFGDVTINNASDIEAVGVVYGATGISAYSGYGNVDLHNTGEVFVGSVYSDAIGLYAYSYAGDAAVHNSGDITAVTYYGLADGIFASGADVDVANSGDIAAVTVYGNWAAGIEAQGTGTTSIDNSGDIYASAYYGQAFGLYATGGSDVTVANEGNIEAQGYYATGIEAQSSGDVTVTNSGDIVAGSLVYGSYEYYGYVYTYVAGGAAVATGINAESNGEGAAVGVTNSGDIATVSYFGGAGISATSSGQGGTASVTNSGNIYASQYTKYGYGAYGIVTSADGDSSIDNSGSIEVVSGGAANGVAALSFAGDAHVTNSGDITTTSFAALGYSAIGINAFAANGNVSVDNSGSINASAKYATGIDARAYGDVTVDNGGSIYADGDKYAFGVYALSNAGDVSVHNEEGGEIEFYSYSGRGIGAFGYATQGDVAISNDGTISGYAYTLSAGVFGIADAGDTSIDNSGTIDVSSGGFGSTAVGLFARADNGTASVTNSGDVTANGVGSFYAIANGGYGLFARGAYAEVSNSGNVVANSDVYAMGVVANSLYGSTVHNTGGSISVTAPGALVYVAGDYGYYGYYVLAGEATGISASSVFGDTTVTNASDISALSVYVSATGIAATAGGDVVVTNSGDIYAATVYGFATGINALDSYVPGAGYADGAVTVENSGDIELVALAPSFGKATGIAAIREFGEVSVDNSGDIDIYAGGRSYGIYAHVKYGDVAVSNSGDISMLSHYDAVIGIQASSGNFFAGGGDVSVVNSGDISVHSDYGFASGIGAVAGSVLEPYGNSYIRNTGDIDVFGQYFAAGIQTRATDGNATVVNTGDVHVATGAYFDYYDPGSAVGIGVLSFFGGNLAIQNSGDVSVQGSTHAYALYAKSNSDGNVSITNAGDVSAETDSTIAWGVYAYSYSGDITVNNTAAGHIDASGGVASVGVQAVALLGDNVINNAGSIHAGGSAYAYAVNMVSYSGTSTLNNASTGVISVDGDDGYAWAVAGSNAVDTINNSGDIFGAVALFGGDDVFNNRSGGLWDVGDTRNTDFGDGNDTINNLAGGVIHLADGAIYMGAGNDGILNLGTIAIAGDENLIDLGGGAQDVLTNVNTISFLDGHTDDALTLVGHLGGTGSLGLDVDLADESSDQLYVEGNMVANAAQRVNIAFAGMPLVASTSIDFAHVSGTSTAGSFVPGQILGYNPARNFLDVAFTIGSRLNAANTADDVFSIELDVVGLNDTGTLAASVATGAAGMLNAQVGTFKQRMGVNPYGDDGKVMSAFFRTYTSEGDVDPAHVATNFGQGGNFAYDQSTWGREVGVNANLYGNFHAGITLGTADGRQRLTGNGVGSNRMDGMTWGLYATWFAPQGFYVDVSGRWMAVDVVSTSAAGQLQSRAHTGAWNLEAGYQWNLGGLSVVPQLQYTRTEIEDVRTFYGDRANFEGHGGTSSRGRVGVEISKTFQAGELRWTPYGSINAIREFDGEMSYTVADNFFGSTGTKGTSAMAELGLGVQKNGWGFTIGANWTDGGAFKSTVGGQALVRFAW